MGVCVWVGVCALLHGEVGADHIMLIGHFTGQKCVIITLHICRERQTHNYYIPIPTSDLLQSGLTRFETGQAVRQVIYYTVCTFLPR